MAKHLSVHKLNRTELASALEKNVSTIDNWIRDGVPFIKQGSKGVNWEFNLNQVVKWRESKANKSHKNIDLIEYEEARRRKIAAEAGILEIDLKKKRREVIDRDEVQQVLIHSYLTIKQRLRIIPERAIPQIMAENDEQICRQLLLSEIDDALLELSQIDLNADNTESS